MIKKLDEVCRFYSGTGFPVAYQGKSDGELPFYKVSDIANNVAIGNVYLSLCNNYISRQEASEIRGSIIPKGTIVFAKIGEALKLNRRAITNCDCLIDNNAMGIAPMKELLRTEYFFYFMKQLKMQEHAETTTVPSVRRSKLEQVEIDVPSLDKQEGIEQILNKTSMLIHLRQQQLQKLDDLVKARFVELTGEAKTTPTRMGDVATYLNGYAFKPEQWEKSGLPIIRIQNLNDSTAIYNYYTGTLPEKYYVQNGDVLVSWATHFEAYIWKGPNAWLNQHIFKVVFDKIVVNKVYFVYACEEALRQAFRNAHGFKPTMEHIKKADFDNAIVKLPPIDVQNQFAAFVTQTDKSKAAVQKALDETQLLFDSLMQKYFQ